MEEIWGLTLIRGGGIDQRFRPLPSHFGHLFFGHPKFLDLCLDSRTPGDPDSEGEKEHENRSVGWINSGSLFHSSLQIDDYR